MSSVKKIPLICLNNIDSIELAEKLNIKKIRSITSIGITINYINTSLKESINTLINKYAEIYKLEHTQNQIWKYIPIQIELHDQKENNKYFVSIYSPHKQQK